MSEHSRYFSPSSISRRISCHGSAELEADIIDDSPKPAADWGTFAHHIADQFFTNNVDIKSFIGKEMLEQVCDMEMIDCVQQYIADVGELLSFDSEEIKSEVKGSLEWLGYPDVFGTADMVINHLFGNLTVCDLKTGSGVIVDPENNPQLMTYALMAAGNKLLEYNEIIIAISQPRGKQGGKSLKVWTTTPEYLLQWFKEVLEPAIIAINNGDKTLNPTEPGCKFCKATNICPAYSNMALQLAKVDFAAVAHVGPVINDELVNSIYPQLNILKDWLKKVEAHAYDMAASGTLQGFKLVKGRKSRDWKNQEAAEMWLKDQGIDPFEKKLLSPARAEKEVSREHKKTMNELVMVSDGTPVIAPLSDKRTAISLAAEDFIGISN